MTAVVLLLSFLAAPAHSFRTPSADEVNALNSDTLNAYADKQNLEDIEQRLQKAAKDDSPNWERKLSQPQQRELAAARLRASASWADVIEKNLVAYGLIKTRPSPVGGPGIPQYPEEEMQLGESKGMRRQWKVQFAQPVEGTVKGKDGKVLRGDDFKKFLEETNGMTSPDGTTIVWGERYLKDPHRLAIVLRHELAHYEQFADPKVEETTWAEREVKAYRRSKSFIKHMGLPPNVQKAEEALEEGGVVNYSGQVSTEKSKREKRPLYERVYDRGREFFGLKPRIEDPGYHQQAGYHMDPEAWQRIRDDGARLNNAVARQRAARALIAVAEEVCGNPASAHDPALKERYRAIPNDAGQVPVISDDCTADIAKYLFGIKGSGSNEFWADAFETMARGHQGPKPDFRPRAVVVTAFQIAAEKICADPVGYPRSSEFRDWFRTERRFDSSVELTGVLPYGCVMSVFNCLWKAQRAGATEVDPDELFRVAERGRVEGTVVPAAPTPSATPAVPAPPPPPIPLPVEPEPFVREPKAPPAPAPYPACLHNRCATQT